MHLPQDGNFLSHFFFFRRQFRQTLDDFAPPSDDGDGGSEAGGFSELEFDACIFVLGDSARRERPNDEGSVFDGIAHWDVQRWLVGSI